MLKETNKVLSIDSDILRFMAEIEELNKRKDSQNKKCKGCILG